MALSLNEYNPLISVIIPACNADKTLGICIDSILKSSHPDFEVIIVDDNSKAKVISQWSTDKVKILNLPANIGPAAARNLGASRAKGEILLFIDADVSVKSDTLQIAADGLSENPELAAIFGSYDTEPAEKNFSSQYRNLFHHFTHQHANENAKTFWAGCGAVKREIYDSLGGFKAERYKAPSIEDVEFGLRLTDCGKKILLLKNLQVKHLKGWKLTNLIHTDIFYRAIPWSELIIERGNMINDLNLKRSQRLSAAFVTLAVFCLLPSFFFPSLFFVVGLLLAATFTLNAKWYFFLYKHRGLLFALMGLPMHILYFVCCSFSYSYCALKHYRHLIIRRLSQITAVTSLR